jgi:hypothetical protein
VKILKLIAENIKKLKVVQIATNGESVIKITGANEQGKTTVLDCIWWALGGTKQIQDQPIRDGQDKAKIQVDLGDFIVKRTFTKSGSTLEVSNKDGAVYKSPQALLDAMIGELSFDLLKFAKASKSDAVQMLLKLVDLKVDTAKLNYISGGLADASTNPIEAINNTYSNVFSVRKSKNADLDRAKKMIESFGQCKEVSPVSIVELVAKRDEIIERNRCNDTKRMELENITESIDRFEYMINNEDAKIIELEKQLKEAIASRVEYISSLGVKKQEYLKCYADVKELKDEDASMIALNITQAEETNKAAQKWVECKRAEAELEQAKKEADSYTSKLDAIKQYKEDLIKSANFPLPDLDFGNGGVLYKGLPFEQASSAQKLQVSLAVAMALNPKLKVIRIDDGSLLDKKHMAIIEQMANDNDYQIWMEVVDESGKVGVVIEDGEVAINNDEVLTETALS